MVLFAPVAAVWLALGILTALGERERGGGVPVAVLAGLAFPLTWIIWYVLDEHPRDRAAHHLG